MCSVFRCYRAAQGRAFDVGDGRGSPQTGSCGLIADRYNNEDFCYLTTTGRITGRPHEIEIWFSLVPETSTLYMLAESDRSDWVRNLRHTPEVSVRISSERFPGRARIIEDEVEDELARRLLVEKYESTRGSLSNWRRTALPVAVDLEPDA